MNSEQKWQAVLKRDHDADGAFVYAVRSTGIYCRPSCPSRRPRREQVVFFAAPAAAEHDGYRACRRCHPRDYATRDDQPAWIQQTRCYIETHLDEPLTLDVLSAQANVSAYHLQRIFKRVLGVSPRQYAEALRLSRFKSRLKKGDSVTGALYEAGYGSSSRLYERASSQLGMTPSVYRNGGEGMQINYAIVDSPLGRLLVAATERGVCFVSLGDSERALIAELKHDYPAAEIERDETHLHAWVSAIVAYLQGRQTQLDLPLDAKGTAFQWRVWRELQAIPYGRTRTYGEIAEALGNPSASRAVGRACATNPVSLVIPCHRAVASDGKLTGYRWGVSRKQKLLEQEHSHAQTVEEYR
jgi:AraC family transcriptional regulator, regulatory protein of adaptative response / methylated-DNA-[protein]-cysteine methyltransferase